jgi:hypothetical protein
MDSGYGVQVVLACIAVFGWGDRGLEMEVEDGYGLESSCMLLTGQCTRAAGAADIVLLVGLFQALGIELGFVVVSYLVRAVHSSLQPSTASSDSGWRIQRQNQVAVEEEPSEYNPYSTALESLGS